jgi:hypothetical protein
MSFYSPSSRFHRIIKKLDRCEIGATLHIPSALEALVENNESLLGIYRADNRHDDLFFTDKSVLFMDTDHITSRRIPYLDILDVVFPLPASNSIELTLLLADRTACNITVVGTNGTYRDVFEVGRFFMRVAEDAALRAQ